MIGKTVIKAAGFKDELLRNPLIVDAILSTLFGAGAGAVAAGEGRRLKGALAGGGLGLVGASAMAGLPRMGVDKLIDPELAKKLVDNEFARKLVGAGAGGVAGGLMLQPQVTGLNHLGALGALEDPEDAYSPTLADAAIARELA